MNAVINTPRPDEFKQVCVWPGTELGDSTVEDFVSFFRDSMNTRIEYLETIETYPDLANGLPVEGTGGRSDIFFAVHHEDIGGFAVPRLSLGIRWIEDVLDNGATDIYPPRVIEYRSW